jgi:hypothetical protein
MMMHRKRKEQNNLRWVSAFEKKNGKDFERRVAVLFLCPCFCSYCGVRYGVTVIAHRQKGEPLASLS